MQFNVIRCFTYRNSSRALLLIKRPTKPENTLRYVTSTLGGEPGRPLDRSTAPSRSKRCNSGAGVTGRAGPGRVSRLPCTVPTMNWWRTVRDESRAARDAPGPAEYHRSSVHDGRPLACRLLTVDKILSCQQPRHK